VELYEIIKTNISTEFVNPVYSRVILPLKALVDGDFFNEYIKRGILIFYCTALSNLFFLLDVAAF
jgi:ribonuclease P/MRP protein subunit RPP40